MHLFASQTVCSIRQVLLWLKYWWINLNLIRHFIPVLTFKLRHPWWPPTQLALWRQSLWLRSKRQFWGIFFYKHKMHIINWWDKQSCISVWRMKAVISRCNVMTHSVSLAAKHKLKKKISAKLRILVPVLTVVFFFLNTKSSQIWHPVSWPLQTAQTISCLIYMLFTLAGKGV